jgi:hypothetical protein
VKAERDVHAEHQARAAEWHGLRPSKATACPRVVAGKRCLVGNTRDELCVCQRHQRLLDHSRMWLDDKRRNVLTGEPYDVDLADLVDLHAELAALGLEVTVAGRSPWNPGETFLLLIRADRDAHTKRWKGEQQRATGVPTPPQSWPLDEDSEAAVANAVTAKVDQDVIERAVTNAVTAWLNQYGADLVRARLNELTPGGAETAIQPWDEP